MDILLDREVEAVIEREVTSGRYASANEVVRAALWALQEAQLASLDEETLAAIAVSEKEFDEGKFIDWDDIRGDFVKGFPSGNTPARVRAGTQD
jgi:putative addiction module CopG family antidote